MSSKKEFHYKDTPYKFFHFWPWERDYAYADGSQEFTFVAIQKSEFVYRENAWCVLTWRRTPLLNFSSRKPVLPRKICLGKYAAKRITIKAIKGDSSWPKMWSFIYIWVRASLLGILLPKKIKSVCNFSLKFLFVFRIRLKNYSVVNPYTFSKIYSELFWLITWFLKIKSASVTIK